MRLLHPTTIKIICDMSDSEFKDATVSRKNILSHAWAEIFKFYASQKSHPKVFLKSDNEYANYMMNLYFYGELIGCKWDMKKFEKLFPNYKFENEYKNNFDDNYLFSDAVSLYYKGVNIFPYIFGDEWRKYAPVINLKEIKRQVDKTLGVVSYA